MKKVRMPLYGQASSLPNAWIVTNNRQSNLSNDRGRKKIYTNNKVYLEDGQEFELELMNPLMNSVLAVISINGQKISSTGLVLRPGERVYLDCFLESRRKFVFNTYQTEVSDEAQKAIQNNGYVQVSFHSEVSSYLITNNNNNMFTTILGSPSTSPTIQDYNSTVGGSSLNSTLYTTSSNGDPISTYYDGILNTPPKSKSSLSSKLNDKLETGRVESGSQSNQTFESVDMNFQSWSVSTVTYQILPEKIKPVTIEDFKPKNYCPGCGKKLSGNDNFCSSCGTKLK